MYIYWIAIVRHSIDLWSYNPSLTFAKFLTFITIVHLCTHDRVFKHFMYRHATYNARLFVPITQCHSCAPYTWQHSRLAIACMTIHLFVHDCAPLYVLKFLTFSNKQALFHNTRKANLYPIGQIHHPKILVYMFIIHINTLLCGIILSHGFRSCSLIYPYTKQVYYSSFYLNSFENKCYNMYHMHFIFCNW